MLKGEKNIYGGRIGCFEGINECDVTAKHHVIITSMSHHFVKENKCGEGIEIEN